MAYQKEIVTVRLAVSPETATYEFGLSDANAEHPLCVYCVVTLHPSERVTRYLENVVRDENGVVTGRVPMAPVTQANINAIKSFCGSTVFPIVAADAGYTNVP
jgi:hypothetical protein